MLQHTAPTQTKEVCDKLEAMDVKNKGVFLTGGARGLGRAIMTALLAKGAKVNFCDIDSETGVATEAALQKEYGADHVTFQQCDVTVSKELEGVFQKAVSTLGAVEICVNNAGIMDERIWEKMIAINTVAQIQGSQLALEHMRRDKGGRGGVIINTVSIAGLTSPYFHPVYNASKHAMIGFTQSWATNPRREEMGVRWGCLCPGPVDTDLMVMTDGKVMDHQVYLNALSKLMLKPEQVSDAFMKMVEDEDSNGGLLVVWGPKGAFYRKRQLVDPDGEGNPQMTDVSFPGTQK